MAGSSIYFDVNLFVERTGWLRAEGAALLFDVHGAGRIRPIKWTGGENAANDNEFAQDAREAA